MTNQSYPNHKSSGIKNDFFFFKMPVLPFFIIIIRMFIQFSNTAQPPVHPSNFFNNLHQWWSTNQPTFEFLQFSINHLTKQPTHYLSNLQT